MKVALIASGKIAIPPPGWGAVEIIIWKHAQTLRERGHEVVIYNTTDLAGVARDINGTKYDFVHLHHDEYIRFFTKHLQKPFCATSHYGYINKPGKWARGYYAVYADFFKAPGVIALSDEIANSYRQKGYGGFLRTLHNGTSVRDFHFKPNGGNGRALCLGKIEPRKRQAWLAQALDGKVSIDFIGPVVDSEFKEGRTTRYRGAWTKEEVYRHLTDYSCLILLSDGEAAPLVVPEAFAAGLSVVVSRSAAANLDTQEFISVVSDDETDGAVLAEIINAQVASNAVHRDRIRAYAASRFDYTVIMARYLAIIDDFRKTGAVLQGMNVKPVGYRPFAYWGSRLAVFLRTNLITQPIVNSLRRHKSS